MGRSRDQMANVQGQIEVPDFDISDQESFERVTGEDRQIAGLYFFYFVDILSCLAYKVSLDFFRRPELYTNLGLNDDIPYALAKLRARYGCHENFLSKQQRHEIYSPLFGQSYDLNSSVSNDSLTTADYSFPILSYQLIHACSTFAASVMPEGEEMLRDAIRRAHIVFKQTLKKDEGASVKLGTRLSLSLTKDTVYPILRNEGVAGVFGVTKAPNKDWPYIVDANGGKLVESISKQLMKDEPDGAITVAQFEGLQETALTGAEAIATAIHFKDRDHSDQDAQKMLITKVYTWGNMWKGLQEGSIARWREPASGDMVTGLTSSGNNRL